MKPRDLLASAAMAPALLASVLYASDAPPILPPDLPPPPDRPAVQTPAQHASPALLRELEESRRNQTADYLRDPFWPVGWTPPDFGLVNSARMPDAGGLRKWNEALERLVISGLVRNTDGSYLANVQGVGIVETGDVISVEFEGMQYKWKVKDVTADGILPERIGVFAAPGNVSGR